MTESGLVEGQRKLNTVVGGLSWRGGGRNGVVRVEVYHGVLLGRVHSYTNFIHLLRMTSVVF